jgi:hypothetical protein
MMMIMIQGGKHFIERPNESLTRFTILSSHPSCTHSLILRAAGLNLFSQSASYIRRLSLSLSLVSSNDEIQQMNSLRTAHFSSFSLSRGEDYVYTSEIRGDGCAVKRATNINSPSLSAHTHTHMYRHF